MMTLKPEEYPALSSGMFALLAAVPSIPRPPRAQVNYGDLARWLPEAVRAEEERSEAMTTGPSLLAFALGSPRKATSPSGAAVHTNWTPEMRARMAEAQRLRGIRQRAERTLASDVDDAVKAAAAETLERLVHDREALLAEAEAEAIAKNDQPEVSTELAAKRAKDRQYRRELHARRKESPRPSRAVCEWCKEEFKLPQRGHKKFCSRTCSRKANDKKAADAFARNRAEKAPKECPHCGTPINQGKQQRGRWRLFCSTSCGQKHKRRERGMNPQVPLTCVEDGCEVEINRHLVPGHKGAWTLRCEPCRKRKKSERNRAYRAKRLAEQALKEGQEL